MSRKTQPAKTQPAQDQDFSKQIDDAVAKDTAGIEQAVKTGDLSREDADALEAEEKELADEMKQGGGGDSDADL